MWKWHLERNFFFFPSLNQALTIKYLSFILFNQNWINIADRDTLTKISEFSVVILPCEWSRSRDRSRRQSLTSAQLKKGRQDNTGTSLIPVPEPWYLLVIITEEFRKSVKPIRYFLVFTITILVLLFKHKFTSFLLCFIYKVEGIICCDILLLMVIGIKYLNSTTHTDVNG